MKKQPAALFIGGLMLALTTYGTCHGAGGEQLATLKDGGVSEWNSWRAANPGAKIDLSEAYLRQAHLRQANLSGANLTQADLRAAKLSGADLSGTNLSGADLTAADVSRDQLSGARGAVLR